jgi:hypothetical protein
MNISNEILQSLSAINNLNFNDLDFSDSSIKLNEDEKLEVKKFNPYLSNCDLLIKLYKDKSELLPLSYLIEKLKDYKHVIIAYRDETFWILIDKQLSNNEYSEIISEFYNKYQFSIDISDVLEDDVFKRMIDNYKVYFK